MLENLPSYLSLYKSGELLKRAEVLQKTFPHVRCVPESAKLIEPGAKRALAGPQPKYGSQKLFLTLVKNLQFPAAKALEPSSFHSVV